MWLVGSEGERRLQQDTVRCRAFGWRIPLVRCDKLREIAREELEIPRSGGRRSRARGLILERIEAAADVPPSRKLIPREDIAAGEVARWPGVGEIGWWNVVGEREAWVLLVQLAQVFHLEDERLV